MKHNNMRIWENVCTTDPKYTKYVNQRGGFTAIDAQYQMQTATEQFGPMGWGWGVKDETFLFIESQGMVIYQAILFYHYGSDGDTIKENEIPLHSSMQVKPDCVKAVATDALTKGLSKLGFNADVFLGKFDDNKYVNDLKKKYAVEPIGKTITKDDGSQFPQQQPKRNGDLSKNLQNQVDKAKSQMNGESTVSKEEFELDAVCNFKKHKGKMWSEVADEDREYISWVLNNIKDLDANTETVLKQFA